LIKQGKLL